MMTRSVRRRLARRGVVPRLQIPVISPYTDRLFLAANPDRCSWVGTVLILSAR